MGRAGLVLIVATLGVDEKCVASQTSASKCWRNVNAFGEELTQPGIFVSTILNQ
jgi:hypothetical protein